MKYKNKYDIWEDLITGQLYIKEFAIRPIVSLDDNGNTIKGNIYSPTELGQELVNKSEDDMTNRETDYPATCLSQQLFLTDEQVAIRFRYLGNVEHLEDIDASIKHYSEEDCDFENKAWLARAALFDLTSPKAGGLTQCVHAKLLDFFLNNALGDSAEEIKIKNIYFDKGEKKNG